jgi:two-component system response regulator YesN
METPNPNNGGKMENVLNSSMNEYSVDIKLSQGLSSNINTCSNNDKIEEIGLCIKNGVEKDSTEIIDKLFDELYCSNNLNLEKAKVLYINIITTIIDSVTEFGFNFVDISDSKVLPYGNLFKSNNLIEMKEFLKKLTLCATKFIKNSQSKKRNKTISDIVQYINANATDPNLSLTKVASTFYMNPSYLSRIFRQVTGFTFVEYITRTRINIALKLFKETDLKGYEIGEKVGIHDPNYFGKCFKKCTGMSLNSYRRIHQ